MNVGVVVGRFQIPELHSGHFSLLDYVSKRNDSLVVFLGVKPSPENKRDPLSYQIRQEMLKQYHPEAIILPIFDNPSDEVWSSEIDRTLGSMFAGKKITLYCGRDGFSSSYSGGFKVEVLNLCEDETASTHIRKSIGAKPLNTSDFRAGIIYSLENLLPRTYLTVDMALVRNGEVLLGRKHNSKYLCFPGGFVDKGDDSFEAAAKRELREETGFVCESEPVYLGSFEIDDWRSRGAEDVRTLTTFFKVDYTYGIPEAGDDLEEVRWCSIKSRPENLGPSHRVLWECLERKCYPK